VDAAPAEPEPAITLDQAMRNVAAITPADAPDPIAALQQAPAAPARAATPAQAPAPAPAPPAPAQPPAPRVPMTIQAPPPLGQGQGDGQRTYTGHPLRLDFQGADLRAVLRGFSEISGLNMVIDPDVQGTVDIILTEVPWDQALEVILRGNQLDYTVDGTIVRIARIDTLKREQDARQAFAKSAADAGTLAVRTFSLSYARAAAAAPLIKKATLSPRGDVQIDERTNTLIVTDLPARLETTANLLATLDRAEPQVEVEARIVQTTRDFARAVGIQWGLNGRVSPDLGNTTGLAFPNRGTLGGRLGSQGSTDPRATELEQSSTAINLPVPGATSALGLAMGAVNGAFNLDVALSALESSGKGRILSTPRLTTQNNIEAEVALGIQIPIQTVANNTVTVSFKDAVLVLKVTPQITAANTVIMKITIENAQADFSRQVNGIPPIDTQRANTQVQVDDGATTVIGGIFVSQEQSKTDQTPVLSRVPLLGWLFKRDSVGDASRELLIFITPRILKG
jgi:type IV pilus assembly protein PilQ